MENKQMPTNLKPHELNDLDATKSISIWTNIPVST